MKTRLALLAAALVLQGTASAQDNICKTCTKQLNLDQARWQCLMRQQETLQKESTSVVFFQLDAANCNGKTRSSTVVIPVEDLPPPNNNSPVFVMTKWQLTCLYAKAKAVQAAGGRFLFDFNTACTP